MDVGVVERRVHLVEHAERAWPEVEDREHEGEPSERALTAREERHGLEPLASRLRHQLHTGVQRVSALFCLHQPQLGTPALEQPLEDLLEVGIDLLEGLGEAFLRAPGHPAQCLVEVLDRCDEVVVLCPEECEALVELAVLVVGDEVHGPDGDEPIVELRYAFTDAREVARRLVAGAQPGLVDAVDAPRLLPELLAPDAALHRGKVELVDPRDEPTDLALDPARLALERAQPGGELLVLLGGEARLALDPVALARDVARGDVRALALLGEPGAPGLELSLPLTGLRQPLHEVALHLPEALELAAECVHTLRRPGQLHAARRQLADEDPFLRLRAVDRVSTPGHGGLMGPLGLSRERDALLDLAQSPRRLRRL